jgi:hypothetical protein
VSAPGKEGTALILHVCESSHVATQLASSMEEAKVKILVRGYNEIHVLPRDGVNVKFTV